MERNRGIVQARRITLLSKPAARPAHGALEWPAMGPAAQDAG